MIVFLTKFGRSSRIRSHCCLESVWAGSYAAGRTIRNTDEGWGEDHSVCIRRCLERSHDARTVTFRFQSKSTDFRPLLRVRGQLAILGTKHQHEHKQSSKVPFLKPRIICLKAEFTVTPGWISESLSLVVDVYLSIVVVRFKISDQWGVDGSNKKCRRGISSLLVGKAEAVLILVEPRQPRPSHSLGFIC